MSTTQVSLQEGKTHVSRVISAPIDKVWAQVRQFNDQSWAPVASVLLASGAPQEVGAKRHILFAPDGSAMMQERLLGLDDVNHVLLYAVEPEAFPDKWPFPFQMKGFVGRWSLYAITTTGETFFDWTTSARVSDVAAFEQVVGGFMTTALATLNERLK